MLCDAQVANIPDVRSTVVLSNGLAFTTATKVYSISDPKLKGRRPTESFVLVLHLASEGGQVHCAAPPMT